MEMIGHWLLIDLILEMAQNRWTMAIHLNNFMLKAKNYIFVLL